MLAICAYNFPQWLTSLLLMLLTTLNNNTQSEQSYTAEKIQYIIYTKVTIIAQEVTGELYAMTEY